MNESEELLLNASTGAGVGRFLPQQQLGIWHAILYGGVDVISFTATICWYGPWRILITPLRTSCWYLCDLIVTVTFTAAGRLLIAHVTTSRESYAVDPLRHLMLALTIAILVESGYQLYRWQKESRAAMMRAHSVRKEDDQRCVDDNSNADRQRTLDCSWPFFWYLLLLGSQSLSRAESISNHNQYEYVGPMRLTKLPSLSYGNDTHDYENLLTLFPCLEDHAYPGPNYGGKFEQPSVTVNLEIGWGSTWGCRSQKDFGRWNTNWPQWSPCTSFICREDGLSTCDCHPDKSTAWNASQRCIQDAFNLTLLEKNITFHPQQPPWEDESNWPTIDKYGNCDGNVGISADIQRVERVAQNVLIYRRFGMVLLAFCSSIIILKGFRFFSWYNLIRQDAAEMDLSMPVINFIKRYQ
mmetsp:Transcript_1400/g.4064  ORF Transcript_1400/g.4064 Transcript_1400/m.4064 type:complete len:411 (-) Transcript_1400:913-2145(-)